MLDEASIEAIADRVAAKLAPRRVGLIDVAELARLLGVNECSTCGTCVTPAACSSRWAASSIGSRCPKSGAMVITSAAITIWCSLATACAL